MTINATATPDKPVIFRQSKWNMSFSKKLPDFL